MTDQPRDLIFLSYSRKDPAIYAEVRQRLIDQGLRGSLWDDTEIRLGERWRPRIQDAMERAAVAVLILSDGYFGPHEEGAEYILEVELPYLLEHWDSGQLDLLPVYWQPSPFFKPDRREPVKPFEYDWNGTPRSFDLHEIQALARSGCLGDAAEPARRDALLALAVAAEQRLKDRLAKASAQGRRGAPRVPTLAQVPWSGAPPAQGRAPLTIEFSTEGAALRRTFRVQGQVVPLAQPALSASEIKDLSADAGRNLPSATHEQPLGRRLYRLLFDSPGGDLFPRLAAAWGLLPGSTAGTLAVAVEVCCDGACADPWPLRLPWHLTRTDSGPLTASGWSFEAVPAGLRVGTAPVLSAEPPLLFLFDERLEGAAGHAAQTVHLIDNLFGFGADCLHCRDHAQVRERVRRAPPPQILYCYGAADLDLAALAQALGEAVPLIVLNLIGEIPPVPPPALVAGRKLIVCVHAGHEADQARDAGTRWLQDFLGDPGGQGHQRLACAAFGPRVRLWSGCADLQAHMALPRGRFYRPQLIKLLLDRVGARRDVADRAAGALAEGRAVLGLVAAGTPADHPELLPEQVWQHYRQYREAESPQVIRRFPLDTGPLPEAAELLRRFASALPPGAVDDWAGWLDREAEGLVQGEHLILSLEWRLAPRPVGPDPDPDPQRAAQCWRRDWLAAWLEFGTQHLTAHARPRVLLVHTLIVTAADAPAATQWTEEAQAAWRALRLRLAETPRERYLHVRLEPLSVVPAVDVEDFLENHYKLAQYHQRLDPDAVARWVCAQTGGVFSATVDLVERLHATAFQAAYDAFQPPA